MHTSTGLLVYRDSSVVVETDPELSRYYFNLMATVYGAIRINKPRYPPHITVIREGEIHPDILSKKKYNSKVEFQYLSNVENDSLYFYIPVKPNDFLSCCRFECGLDWCYDKKKGFHITIGNMK